MARRSRRPLKSVRHITPDDFMACSNGCLVARYPPDEQLQSLWQVILLGAGQLLTPGEGDHSLCLVSSHPASIKIKDSKVNLTSGAVMTWPSSPTTLEVNAEADGTSVLSIWTAAGASHHMRSFQLDNEEMVVVGEEGSLLVLYGISGSCTAYFPRLMKLGQQMCLCPDCRADGGGDGFKLREGEVLLLTPAEGIAVVAPEGPAGLVAISIWTRAPAMGAKL